MLRKGPRAQGLPQVLSICCSQLAMFRTGECARQPLWPEVLEFFYGSYLSQPGVVFLVTLSLGYRNADSEQMQILTILCEVLGGAQHQ